MQFIFLLPILVITQAAVIKEEDNKCTGIEINDKYYNEEVLKTDIDRPFLLAIDRSRNVLYFSYNLEENSDNFTSARLDLNSNEFRTIDDINNGFAQTVDPETNDVYIGGTDGLYKYDYNTHKSELIGEKGNDIWSVFFKDILYFSVFPSQFLYTLSNKEVSRFKDLQDTKVDHFLIDSNDVMYFTNTTGFYSMKKGTSEATLYRKHTSDENVIRGITTDTEGKVYVCMQNEILKVDPDNKSLDSVLEVDDAFGLAFDSDNNMIYSDATRLVRLTPKKDNTC